MAVDPTSGRGQHLVADALLSPLVGSALLLLFLNDRWGKERWPGTVTGKVSDVAGLVFFPIVLVAGLEALRLATRRRRETSRVELEVAVLVTGLGFAAVKLSPDVASWYSDALGALQWPVRATLSLVAGDLVPGHAPVVVLADPWDLLALPGLLVGLAAGRRQLGPAGGTITSGRLVPIGSIAADRLGEADEGAGPCSARRATPRWSRGAATAVPATRRPGSQTPPR